MDKKSNYQTISAKIQSLKEVFPGLRKKPDEHVFTVLCVKANFFKNPSLSFTEADIDNLLVDSVKDGGVDALFSDPNSETNNLIICQSKYYESITFDAVRDAVAKMILFYKGMDRGEYETVNEKVQRRFLSLNAEIGEESKVCFVFYTSAPKNGIREDRIRKLLKQIDLKSNAPEQVRFGNEMRNVGIFYQTKRGEVIPRDYREDYKNTDLVEVGKLCLAGIFQLPGSSRSKPSTLYLEKYYNPVFNGDQMQICSLVKELLYIDSYYKKTFITKFDKAKENSPNAAEIIPFAHNARTICISFVALASRFYYKNIKPSDLKTVFDHVNKDKAYDDYYYDIFKELDDRTVFVPKKIFECKDKYDEILYKLFEVIISSGRRYYSVKKESDSTLNESNFLKRDSNYFAILKSDWENIETKINEVFGSID